MDRIGIDLHKNNSQVCILTEEGELIERRVRMTRARFAEVFGGRKTARILIEASTESEWVAQCLEELGHEVVVDGPTVSVARYGADAGLASPGVDRLLADSEVS
jgi:transposase